MKKVYLITIVIFLLTVSVLAQSNSTKPNDKLESLNNSIFETESQIKEKNIRKENLSVRYLEKHPEIQKINSELEILTIKLAILNKEKSELLTAEFLRNLPNNQIELLKIIISQNEKIIKLLEKIQKP